MKGVRLITSGLTSLILISALVSGGAWYIRTSAAKKEQAEQQAERRARSTVVVTEREFEQVISLVGKLEAIKSTPLTSEVGGQVVRVIPNGSRVKKGDIILELDTPRMSRQVRDMQRNYDRSLEQLTRRKKELGKEVEQSQLALTQQQEEFERFKADQQLQLENQVRQQEFDKEDLVLAKKRFERLKRQVDVGLIPKQQLESEEASLKAREIQLQQAEKRLELFKAQQASDLREREVQLQRAQANSQRAKDAQQDEISSQERNLQMSQQQLKRSKDQLAKAIIRAPSDGLIVLGQGRFGRGENLSPGDMVYEGHPIGNIPDLSKMRVSLELSQEQVRMVKKGVKARVRVESITDRTFTGEVTEITQNAQEQRSGGYMPTGERVFPTSVLLKDIKGVYLRPGTTGVVTLIIDHIPKALTIPLECIFDRDGKKIVYVQRGNDFKMVEVELGPQNTDIVVVKKGVKAGDRVAMYDVRNTGETTAAGKSAGSDLPF